MNPPCEDSVRRAESEIRDVIDAIPAMVWIAAPDGKGTFINRAWTEYLGLSLEEILGFDWPRTVHPDDVDRYLAAWRLSLASSQPLEQEVRYRRADGEYRWFLSRALPVRNKRGEIVEWYGIVADIEDRKRAEDALRASECFLLEAQRLTHTCSWRHEVLSDKVTVSPEGLLMYGIEPEDDASSADFYFRRMHPKDRPEVEQAYAAALLRKTDFEADFRIVRPDGTIINTRSIGHPILDERGDVVEFVGASIDVTEHHRAEQALRRSEAYLAEAQRLAKTGSWAYNPAAEKAIYWSDEMLRMFGLDPQRSNPPDGEEFLRLMHPEDRDRFNELYERSRIQKTDWNADYRIVLPDGGIKHFHVVHHPVLNESGDLVENFGTAIDVTEQAQARIELEKAFEEIKERTEAARRSERELRDVVNTVPAHVWSTSPEGQVDFVNDRWLQFTGLALDEAFGWKWEAVLHPDDRTRVVADWHTALKNGQAMESEARVRRADGEYCWWFIRNVPLRDETGKLVRWYGTAIDIEDRKRAEQALKRSEAYLAEAQKLTKTGSWAWDPRADLILYCSDEIYRIFEVNPADGIPSIETLMQRVHPDDRTRLKARIEEGVRDKVEHSFEYRIMLPDGNVKYLRNLRRTVINDAGEVVEVIGTTMDITQRKQAEEAKKAAEELASSHVEVMMRSLDVLVKEPAPEKYIAEILRTIAQHLCAHRVMLWLREQNDDSLRLHTVILNDELIVTDETDHPFVRTSSSWKQIPFLTGMLATKSTAVCEDVEHDSRLTSEWRKYLTSRKTKRLVSVPMFLAGEFRGFISIHHSEAGTYRPDEIELAQSLAQHVMMAVHGQQVAEQERQAAILKERARLARDVHDTLAQGFTGVILQMEAAEEALFDENPDAAVQRVRRAREIARESLGEARRSVHALRPQALDKSGFAEALQSMLKNTTVGTSLRTSFCSEGEPMVLPANVEETLLRIGQEALSNALKHAHPTEFHIRLCFKSDAVRLELFDNGKGFVVGQTNGGVGLLGMKERAEQIGATLTISSEPGKGTKVIAVSPNKVETVSS